MSVPVFVTVTLAPGTAAPDGSVTAPKMAAVVACPARGIPVAPAKKITSSVQLPAMRIFDLAGIPHPPFLPFPCTIRHRRVSKLFRPFFKVRKKTSPPRTWGLKPSPLSRNCADKSFVFEGAVSCVFWRWPAGQLWILLGKGRDAAPSSKWSRSFGGAAGVVRSTSDNRWLEPTTPSVPAKEASRHFLNGRSHPSMSKEGTSAFSSVVFNAPVSSKRFRGDSFAPSGAGFDTDTNPGLAPGATFLRRSAAKTPRPTLRFILPRSLISLARPTYESKIGHHYCARSAHETNR